MIFTGPIDKITWDDVIAFCNRGVKENFVLDYKADFPKDLEKTISAIANTYGGVIIIGVPEADGKPVLPPAGIKFERGLAERVNQIVIDNIYPPIFPEVHVVPDKDGKTFVIVRVPQSEETPHTVLGRKHIYIRAQNVTKPTEWEEFAAIDQVEWLMTRREKSMALHGQLLQQAIDRGNNYLGLRSVPESFGVGSITIAPRYPHSSLKTTTELQSIIQTTFVNGYHGEFPPNRHQAEPVQGGLTIFSFNEDSKWFCYTEMNQYGMFYLLEDFGQVERENQEGKSEAIIKHKIYLYTLIARLDLSMEYASKLFSALDFNGIIDMQFKIKDILGKTLVPLNPTHWNFYRPRLIVDQSLTWKLSLTSRELADESIRRETLLGMLDEIAWSFGLPNHQTMIRQYLQNNNRIPK